MVAEQQHQEVADRLQIAEVLAKWHQALDAADWAALRDEVFAEDVEWEFEGSDGTRTFHASAAGSDVIPWLSRSTTGQSIQHFNGNHVYHLDRDQARTRSSMHALDTATLETVGAGVVTAEHVRTQTGWRIRKLRVDERVAPAAIDWMLEVYKAS